jgi:hypothetical protein
VWSGAGVCKGEAVAPTKGATAGGGGRSGGDDIIDEMNGQGLHGASGANDGVLLNRQAGQTAKASGARGFYGMGAGNGAIDTGTGDKLGNGASKRKVGGQRAVTCGDWHKPARAVDEGGHSGGRNLDRFRVGLLQVLGRASGGEFVGAECAKAKRDILGGVSVGIHGVKKILAD